ncbi:MAG: hypothetical protein AABX00_06180 [Nanoarchaeota archaeon]
MTLSKKKRIERLKMHLIFLALAMNFIIMAKFALAPPSSHNVEGQVFANGSANGVPNEIPITINDTITEDFVFTYVNGVEETPELRGTYSDTISGNDGDFILVTSWNATHYGIYAVNLSPTTTTANVILNTTRPSEENVTIVFPANNSILNKTVIFSFFANISILGGDGFDCNTSINFTDRSIINISEGEKPVHPLGDIISRGYKLVNWSITGTGSGNANVTVIAFCASDGAPKFSTADPYSSINLTMQNIAPLISSIRINNPVDLLAGNNLSLLCNISVTEYNSILDIRNVNATFYLDSAGLNAPDDNNDHYTNRSCVNMSSSQFQSNYSCQFKVAHYASNGTWRCNASVADFDNFSAYANISTVVNELLAVDFDSLIIDYGNLKATNTSSSDFNLTMINAGNVPINLSFRSFAPNESMGYLNLSMNCPVGNISNNNQRFSMENGTAFSLMKRANNETQDLNVTLYQKINDNTAGNDTNTTYWKLQVPALTYGICNGTVLFTARFAGE